MRRLFKNLSARRCQWWLMIASELQFDGFCCTSRLGWERDNDEMKIECESWLKIRLKIEKNQKYFHFDAKWKWKKCLVGPSLEIVSHDTRQMTREIVSSSGCHDLTQKWFHKQRLMSKIDPVFVKIKFISDQLIFFLLTNVRQNRKIRRDNFTFSSKKTVLSFKWTDNGICCQTSINLRVIWLKRDNEIIEHFPSPLPPNFYHSNLDSNIHYDAKRSFVCEKLIFFLFP